MPLGEPHPDQDTAWRTHKVLVEQFTASFKRPPRKLILDFDVTETYWATHSRIGPMIAVAKAIKQHWDSVLNWFNSNLTNAFLEGINSLIQAAKSRAKGYRSNRNFIAMAYLIGAKLDFELPT